MIARRRATAREHNDANVLTLGAKLISPEIAREINRAVARRRRARWRSPRAPRGTKFAPSKRSAAEALSEGAAHRLDGKISNPGV